MSELSSDEVSSQNAHVLLVESALKGSVDRIMNDQLMLVLRDDSDSVTFAIKRICEIVQGTMDEIDKKFSNMYEEKLKTVSTFLVKILLELQKNG